MLLTIFSASGRAGRDSAGGWRGSGLPSGGQQDAEVVPVGHCRQAFEHVGQPDLGVVAVTFGALDHGVDDGGTLTGGFAAHEQPVFLPHRGGPDAVFDEVVVDLDLAAIKEERQPVPDLQGVVDGSTELPLGQDLRVLAQGDQFALEDLKDGGGLLPADGGAFVRRGASFAQPGFDPVDLLDGGKGTGGEALADLWVFIVAPLAGGAVAGLVYKAGLTKA